MAEELDGGPAGEQKAEEVGELEGEEFGGVEGGFAGGEAGKPGGVAGGEQGVAHELAGLEGKALVAAGEGVEVEVLGLEGGVELREPEAGDGQDEARVPAAGELCGAAAARVR